MTPSRKVLPPSINVLGSMQKETTMDCRKFQAELPDVILTAGAALSSGAVAHMQVCPPCAEEYRSLRKTFGMLDQWTAPEPSPYFNQKLAVRLREEQAAPTMGWFERLQTRALYNTSYTFRPVMAGALALALVVGGGSFAGLHTFAPHHPAPASATVNDLQILDHNEQAFQQMDELQQDEENGSQSNEDGSQVAPPVS